jgi:hypothetical protein
VSPPTLGGGYASAVQHAVAPVPTTTFTQPLPPSSVTSKDIEDHLSVQSIIRSYQV